MKFEEYEEKILKTSRLNINLPLDSKRFLEEQANLKHITMTDYVIWLIEKEKAESRKG